MARVRLQLHQPHSRQVFRYLRPDGSAGSIPALRLRVLLDLTHHVVPGRQVSSAAFPDCVLDTGSHLSTVPERIHSHFKSGVVTPLPFAPTMPVSQREVTLAGGKYPFELGQIAIRLRDTTGGALDITIIAKFVHDGGALNSLPFLLGLRGGLLEDRTLKAEPDPASPYGQ